MAQNFVHGVEATAELTVSMKRINDFLSLPEPPAPAHLQAGTPMEDSGPRQVGSIFACTSGATS